MPDTDREARLEDMLERERYEEALKRFAQNTAGTLDHIREGKYRRWLEAHDAALRAEIDRLRARLSELEYAARSYVQSGAVNERDRLKAKLEGGDDASM